MVQQMNRKVAERDSGQPGKPVARLQYDPHLLRLLAAMQNDLKKSYDQLIAACDEDQPLSVRSQFVEFKDTLRVYLSITSIHLYVYLRSSDLLDTDKKRIVAVNEQEAKEAALALTRYIDKYTSPSAVYDSRFREGLESVWTILNWRAYKERMELFPLYYATRF